MPNSKPCKNSNLLESYLLDLKPEDIKKVSYGTQYLFDDELIVNIYKKQNVKDKCTVDYQRNFDSTLIPLIDKKIELIDNP